MKKIYSVGFCDIDIIFENKEDAERYCKYQAPSGCVVIEHELKEKENEF